MKEKIGYAALGAMLFFAIQALMYVWSSPVVGAQGKTMAVDTLVCKSLWIVDEEGKIWARLEAVKPQDPKATFREVVTVYNETTSMPAVSIRTDFKGGSIVVNDSAGRIRSAMTGQEVGGGIGVFGDSPEAHVGIGALAQSGFIHIRSKDGSVHHVE